MKAILLGLSLIFFMNQKTMAEPVQDMSAATTQMFFAIPVLAAMPVIATVVCGKEGGSDHCKKYSGLATTVGILVTLTIPLKEINEVKPDAIDYQIDGQISTQLQSVVEKIQAEALEQGYEVTFENAVDAIAQA